MSKYLDKLYMTIILSLTQVSSSFAGIMTSDNNILQIMINQDEYDLSVKSRSRLAGLILEFWKDLDARTPRNSPATVKWLEGELNTKDTVRINRLVSTPEYAIKMVSEEIDACVSDSNLLINSIGTGKSKELYAWLRISGCYGNSHGFEHYLQSANLTKDIFEGPITAVHYNMLRQYITGKIANSVMFEAE